MPNGYHEKELLPVVGQSTADGRCIGNKRIEDKTLPPTVGSRHKRDEEDRDLLATESSFTYQVFGAIAWEHDKFKEIPLFGFGRENIHSNDTMEARLVAILEQGMVKQQLHPNIYIISNQCSKRTSQGTTLTLTSIIRVGEANRVLLGKFKIIGDNNNPQTLRVEDFNNVLHIILPHHYIHHPGPLLNEMLSSVTIDLDPVDRRRSTVGGLGPRRRGPPASILQGGLAGIGYGISNLCLMTPFKVPDSVR
ncbi:hypothetical protein M9H77_21950 [Catharanthus roseus]|uniref:Uncharacterized protein n=1 Tax=Catharanthus roseus TaxID=4058 RepID=A0ACC0ARL3_CATRO|nr:hypothetical protein M9H77_21950 [Catharanthus roseus]